jgi:hypothetical protein
LTGSVSFVPPFGFNTTTIKDAKFTGTKQCGTNANENCDFFDFDAGKGKSVTFAFVGKVLYSVEEKSSGKSRKASFSNYVLKNPPADVLQPPSGVDCHAP